MERSVLIIIPAIDLKDSYCVRLKQGKVENIEIFSKDPCAMAKNWEKQGAEFLHVVDLDGAFRGRPFHHLLIRRMAEEVNIPIQVGGGIRDEATIRQYLDWGVRRVVLGTFLLRQDHERIKSLIQQFGPHLVAGIDVKNDHIAIQGWVDEVDQPIENFICYLKDLGFSRMIHTDIRRDGMLEGPNIKMIQRILQKSQIKMIASGGITTMDDLAQLQNLAGLGLEGVIIGKALYKGNIELKKAIRKFRS